MSVSIKNFVDVNIQKRITETISGTRDTFVVFHDIDDLDIESITSFDDNISSENLKKCVKIFFDNGGKKIKFIKTTLSELSNAVEALNYDEIYFTYYSDTETNAEIWSALKTVIENRVSVEGIDEKIALCGVSKATYNSNIKNVPLTDVQKRAFKNLVVKYNDVSTTPLQSAFSIAAYLSKIDVYGIDTIQDYAFTQEIESDQNITDEEYKDIVEKNHVNIDIILANATRVVGGDSFNGDDFVNNFVRIILCQTLTSALLNTLVQKIKGSSGVSKIYATIVNELEKYKTNGYLSTDKIYSGETISKNNQILLDSGTPLSNGYVVRVILADDFRSATAYVIYSDAYGIRKITVNGEIV